MDIPEVTDVAVRVVLLFLPGIISAESIRVLTSHGRNKGEAETVHFIASVLILGFVSYETTALILKFYREWMCVWALKTCHISLWGSDIRLHFFGSLQDKTQGVDNREIMYVSAVAFFLSLAISWCLNRDFPLKLLKKWGFAR